MSERPPALRATCRPFWWCLFCFLFFFQSPLAGEELAQQLSPLLSNPNLKGALVGISVISLPDKNLLYSHNSQQPFVVASNMKLFTTAAALDSLGSSYQFSTKVYSRGSIDQTGKLLGDIIVKGGGDPSISGRFNEGKVSAVLEAWAEAVLQTGIKEVGGDVVADASFFDEEWVHQCWPKDQLLTWYCAPISALSLNDNCVDITLRPDRDGKVRVELEPPSGFLKIFNLCKVSDRLKKSRVHIHRDPESGAVYIKGEIPSKRQSQKYSLPMDNPPLFLITTLREVLERKGIKVCGQPRLLRPEERSEETRQLIMTTTSPMSQAVMVANTNSQNFYAEQILKTLGAEVKGQGSFSAGLEVIKELMSKLGYEPSEYQVADGSGLCRENKLSPQMITDLLAFMYQHKEKETFVSSLPVSGTTGSLRRRLKDPSSAGKIRAKTGYISRACNLSGYVETEGGETLAFSILVNDFKTAPAHVKEFQDSVCKVLIGYGNGSKKNVGNDSNGSRKS